MIQQKDLLQESIEFISGNLNATTHDVPIHLLKYWETDLDMPSVTSIREGAKGFTVFIYALTKHNETRGKEEFELTPKELISLFNDFVTLVSIGIINRQTNVHTLPIKLFDFDNYSNLNIQAL